VEVSLAAADSVVDLAEVASQEAGAAGAGSLRLVSFKFELNLNKNLFQVLGFKLKLEYTKCLFVATNLFKSPSTEPETLNLKQKNK
jgi:hypothetical protein